MRKFASLILVVALLALALGLLLVTNAQTENQGKTGSSQGMNIELSKLETRFGWRKISGSHKIPVARR